MDAATQADGAAPASGAAATTQRGVIVLVALLTAVAFWLRWRACPGAWGADAIYYADAIVHGVTHDGRSERAIFLAVVEAALRLGDWAPAAASLPSAILSAAVVPALWLALRRVLGALPAAAVAASWAFLQADFREVVRVSNDGWIVLPAVLACAGLLAAARDPDRATRGLILAGAMLGFGVAVKETLVFALAGFPVGALCVGRGWARARNALVLGASGAAVLAVILAVNSARVAAVTKITGVHPWEAQWGRPEFVHRLTVEVPAMLFTTRDYFGLLFVAGVPLLVRLPFRALRGDAIAAAACACAVAGTAMTVSLSTWALLPAEPRYYLWLAAILLVAAAAAFADEPASPFERIASLAAAALGLVFVGRGAMTAWLVPVGLIVAAWPALPAAARRILPDMDRAVVLGAVLTLAAASGSQGLGGIASSHWLTAGAVTAIVAVAAFAGGVRLGTVTSAAAAMAFVASVALTIRHWNPDTEWTTWDHLPRTGTIWCDSYVAKRLRFAALHAGADPARVVNVHANDPVPAIAEGDRIVARRGTALEQRCRSGGSGLVTGDEDLGTAVVFSRAPR